MERYSITNYTILMICYTNLKQISHNLSLCTYDTLAFCNFIVLGCKSIVSAKMHLRCSCILPTLYYNVTASLCLNVYEFATKSVQNYDHRSVCTKQFYIRSNFRHQFQYKWRSSLLKWSSFSYIAYFLVHYKEQNKQVTII